MKISGKGAFCTVLLFILMSTVVFAFGIQRAKAASETIYIKADGTVEPPTANITTLDNVTYTFTSDNYLSMVIERNNITIDGAGYLLERSGPFYPQPPRGIFWDGVDNVTVENINIQGFYQGVYTVNSSYSKIANSNLTSNTCGIYLNLSSNIIITANIFGSEEGEGVFLLYSSNASLTENAITSSQEGIGVSFSSNVNIEANNVTADRIGLRIFSSSNVNVTANTFIDAGMMVFSSNNIVKDNTVNGKPLVYLEGVSDYKVIGAGQVILVNSNNIQVENLNLSRATVGVELLGTIDSTITNNSITANAMVGISLVSSSNVSIMANNVTNNEIGIDFESASKNTVSGNDVTGNVYSIELMGSNNNTLSSNNIVANTFDGISVYNDSHNNTIFDNNITANQGTGISIFTSDGSILSGNLVADNANGIQLYGAPDSILLSNNITTNLNYGISLAYSSGSTLSDNAMADNPYNFGVYSGYRSSDFMYFIDTSNSVNGKPVYYLVNQSNITINPENYPDVGYLGLFNCENVTVEGLTLTDNIIGLTLAFTNNSKITGNNFVNNLEGLYLYFSYGNTVSWNNITSNNHGILLISSSGNNVLNNDVTNNSGGVGIDLASSSDNVLSGNNIATNTRGVELAGSSNNTLFSNDIANNIMGIYLSGASDNRIFHNNFLNNTYQTYKRWSMAQPLNTWDDGYPSGGNYWSNYNGTDLNHGQYQNIMGSDGIGDTPYIMDTNNTDHYPLMAPFQTYSAGTWNNVSYGVGIVCNSTLSNFNFNATARTLTFDVMGMNGTMGFSRVAIPKGLMWSYTNAEWTVTVNGMLVNDRFITNDTINTYIYFTYHHSTEPIQIQSTNALPEFQSLQLILPLLITATLLTALTLKKRLKPHE